MARLNLQLLGTYQVKLDGTPVSGFESDKVRALLAYLVYEADISHRREKLAGLLWPEKPESRARRNLSQAIYNLRTILNDHDSSAHFLEIHRDTLQFNLASDQWSDVSEFTSLVEACRGDSHEDIRACEPCLERLVAAADLYQGSFLSGTSLDSSTAFEEWVLISRERLHRIALQALTWLAESFETRRDLQKALSYTWQQLEIDRLWEPAHYRAMRLLAGSGQRSAALLQYETCHRLLNEELGISPNSQTMDLYRQILSGAERSSYDRSGRGIRSASGSPNNLPADSLPFIGRSAELAALKAYFGEPDRRLITILGPGGSGKSRLALEVARNQLDQFPDGAWWVSLSTVSSSHMLAPALANALGFQFQDGIDQNKQLFDYIHPRKILLVLDNFETVQDGGVWVNQLLQAAPQARVLVTSRTALNLSGEQLFTLRGMNFPKDAVQPGDASPDLDRYCALGLFQASAQRVNPDIVWDRDAWQSAIRICQQVQGLPLGLLLAAGWAATFTPAQIADEIDGGLDFLRTTWRDLPERQRSLRATFDHSWKLLSASERSALCSLSIFRGGFTQVAAETAAAVSAITLRGLLNKSLLERGPDGRYNLHELLRQYSNEKLAKSPESERSIQEQHAGYYLRLLPAWEAGIKSSRQAATLAEMEVELGNLRTAWECAVGHNRLDMLTNGLEGFCLFYGQLARYPEGKVLCESAFDKLVSESESVEEQLLRLELKIWEAYFTRQMGDFKPVQGLLAIAQRRLEKIGSTSKLTQRCAALFAFVRALFEDDLNLCMAYCLDSLSHYRELGDRWRCAGLLSFAGRTALHLGDFSRAIELHRESLAIRKNLGEPRQIANSAQRLSYAYTLHGDIDLALQFTQVAVKNYHAAGDPISKAEALRHLGTNFVLIGRYVEAVPVLEESLTLQRSLNRSYSIAHNLGTLSMANMHLGEYDLARNYLTGSMPLFQNAGYWREYALGLLFLGCADLAQGLVSQASQNMLASASLLRQMQYGGELGWALGAYALTELKLGNGKRARECLAESLKICVKSHSPLAASTCISAAALLLIEIGEYEAAISVYSTVSKLLIVSNSRWFMQVIGQRIAQAAETLPSEEVRAAQERGKHRDTYEAAEWLLENLSSRLFHPN